MWPEQPIVKDSFWDKALNEPVESNYGFECGSSDNSGSGMLLDPQICGQCSLIMTTEKVQYIPPRSVLRMRLEREDVPFCGIRFEFKTQRHQALISELGECWLSMQ